MKIPKDSGQIVIGNFGEQVYVWRRRKN